MKKGTMIECIETVVMTSGEIAFVKGKQYRTYPYSYVSGWDELRKTICAKNEDNERHIVYDQSREQNEFFETHFKIVGEQG